MGLFRISLGIEALRIFSASITSTSLAYCALSGVQMSPRTNSGISLSRFFCFFAP